MNILFIAPNICMDCTTGDVTHVTELANNLVKLGNKVILIARLKGGKKKIFPFKFENVGYTNNSKIWIPVVMIGAFVSGFYILLTKKIDVIYERHHVFGIGVLLGKIFGVPTIGEVNGLIVEESEEQGKYGSLSYMVAKKWERYVFNAVNKIIIGSPELKIILVEEYQIPPDKIELILNGSNIDVFKPMTNTKSKINFDECNKYVCFIGNIVNWQGLDYLIECAPLVVGKIRNAKFIIVGSGPDENRIREKIEQNGCTDYIICVGSVPYNDVPLYINASDVCITLKKELKSGYSPTKLYEYMACEKPVIASNFSGHQILKQYDAGILVDPSNIDEVSESIILLLNNNDLCVHMGINGRKIVIEKFSWERVAKDIMNISKVAIKYDSP